MMPNMRCGRNWGPTKCRKKISCAPPSACLYCSSFTLPSNPDHASPQSSARALAIYPQSLTYRLTIAEAYSQMTPPNILSAAEALVFICSHWPPASNAVLEASYRLGELYEKFADPPDYAVALEGFSHALQVTRRMGEQVRNGLTEEGEEPEIPSRSEEIVWSKIREVREKLREEEERLQEDEVGGVFFGGALSGSR